MGMTVGQNVRKYRQLRKLTQWQLSQIVVCSPGALLLIERGQRDCDAELIQAFARALNVSKDDLKG